MLDEKRIKEAQKNLGDYTARNLIWKYDSFKENIFNTYKKNYRDSLEIAEKIYKENLSNLWVIVISYYSMYYIANAVLYKIGYKVGTKISHKVTADALIVLVKDKLKKTLIEEYEQAKEEALDIIGRKTDEIISSFDREMKKRSVFQYEATEEIKKAKAETSLKRAKEFVFEMKKLL